MTCRHGCLALFVVSLGALAVLVVLSQLWVLLA